MTLNLNDIKRIADFAQLEIPDTEYDIDQLNKLFNFVNQIQEIHTTDITPFSHPIEQIHNVKHRFRDDVVTEVVNREDNQRSAPAVYKGLYLVPKVIE
ncbi:MAG: Asp-tRNA(Asn)/Glu-tRNA(Gln) amidotransferase subunit GatC [Burkholderia sp.]|nr:Asp-tRNA(Asn)/Glu-tRNA(Gln) amidotransferase subunit GatC [Burkholderia sp.]